MSRYKVLEILNTKEIIINYGFENGAQKGDKLRIVETGEPIIVDGKDYGTYDAIKAEVSVSVVYEKFSVCKSVITVSFSPLTEIIASTITRSTTTTDEPLNVDRSLISNRKLPAITPIKVGDRVVILSKIKH